jgi:two-component system sensor histidine kinase DesK
MIDRVHGRFRYAWLFSAVWLVYLGYPLHAAWQQPDPTVRTVGITAILLFATTFVLPFSFYQRRRRAQREIPLALRWAVLAAMAILLVVAAPAAGESVVGGTVYIAVTAVLTLPFVQAWSAVAATVIAVMVIPRFVPGWSLDAFFGLQVVVSSVAAWGITQVIARGADLAYAREQLAELAVVAERDRVARDMHDILGHSLTVIAVKAELALRLMSLDPGRARQEVADVERLARQSLADVRETVGGLRRVTLAGELAGARTALQAAGIDAFLPATIDDVPGGRDELYGWVVREGTTNVIRHSGATRCEIRLRPNGVEVLDDGHGADPGIHHDGGHGLRGLSERVEAAGGALSAGPRAAGGFRLAISAPIGAR